MTATHDADAANGALCAPVWGGLARAGGVPALGGAVGACGRRVALPCGSASIAARGNGASDEDEVWGGAAFGDSPLLPGAPIPLTRGGSTERRRQPLYRCLLCARVRVQVARGALEINVAGSCGRCGREALRPLGGDERDVQRIREKGGAYHSFRPAFLGWHYIRQERTWWLPPSERGGFRFGPYTCARHGIALGDELERCKGREAGPCWYEQEGKESAGRA